MARPRETFPCPVCGAEVVAGSASCKSCGADAATGWAPGAVEEGQELDLPETHLDDERYEEFLQEDLEGGTLEPRPPTAWGFFLVVCIVLAVAAVLALLTSGPK